jgi:hypothetical protein
MASRFLTVISQGTDEPQCETCIYFAARPRTAIYGDCRRNPPTILTGQDDRFPAVEKTEWCGEWHDGRMVE